MDALDPYPEKAHGVMGESEPGLMTHLDRRTLASLRRDKPAYFVRYLKVVYLRPVQPGST
jgi:hypothetical protein